MPRQAFVGTIHRYVVYILTIARTHTYPILAEHKKVGALHLLGGVADFVARIRDLFSRGLDTPTSQGCFPTTKRERRNN